MTPVPRSGPYASPTLSDDQRPFPARRVALCVFADTPRLFDLAARLGSGGVASSVLAPDRGSPAADAAPVWLDPPDWPTFLDLVRRGATRSVTARLGRDLRSGRHLLLIQFRDAEEESRHMRDVLCSGALSIQLHDL